MSNNDYHSDSKHISVGGGLSLSTVLTIVFVILKLTGVISWSWVWVLSPLWIGLALWLVLAIIVFIAFIIVSRRE